MCSWNHRKNSSLDRDVPWGEKREQEITSTINLLPRSRSTRITAQAVRQAREGHTRASAAGGIRPGEHGAPDPRRTPESWSDHLHLCCASGFEIRQRRHGTFLNRNLLRSHVNQEGFAVIKGPRRRGGTEAEPPRRTAHSSGKCFLSSPEPARAFISDHFCFQQQQLPTASRAEQSSLTHRPRGNTGL